VIIIVKVEGNALVLLNDADPKPSPDTFEYPKAFNCALNELSPLKPVSMTVFPSQITSHLSGILYAEKSKSVLPVPKPTSTVTVNIPRPPLPAQASDSTKVLQVVELKNNANGVKVGVGVGVLVGVEVLVGVTVGVEVLVGVGVLEGIVEQSVNANTVPPKPISTPQIVDPLCNLQYLTPPSNRFDKGDCVV
jgi:hypothetical protein